MNLASNPALGSGPAQQLLGLQLLSGWRVIERLEKSGSQTGSTFCATYRVERNGEIAFLKAIDFVAALATTDPFSELQKLTHVATFEKDMLNICLVARASKVVRLLDHEYFTPPAYEGNPSMQVFCMVLEHGQGDLRQMWDASAGHQPHSWKLSVLRDVGLGLEQLHRIGIAHQDVKPSNVLVMKAKDASQEMKVCDLGRVVRKGHAGPYDVHPWPGDQRYAPPEIFYGFQVADWHNRREAADAYLLASLMFFIFTGQGLNGLLHPMVPRSHWPGSGGWQGDYSETLVLVLRDALVRCVHTHLVPCLPKEVEVRSELTTLVLELADPDPTRRGDPRARKQSGSPVGLDRYHPKFLRLAHLMRVAEIKSKL